MKIYEKIFARLAELHMSQSELSRRTEISTSTINDWKKKEINPQADKLVTICNALDMSLTDLLCDEEAVDSISKLDYNAEEKYLIDCYRKSDSRTKKNLIKYLEFSIYLNGSIRNKKLKHKRNVSVIQDIDKNNIVVINDIIFRGKQSIKWEEVEEYLRQYVGDFYTVADTKEVVYIGKDLPDEYAHSEYTNILKGANAKAKANAAQGIPELIEIATGKRHTPNTKKKHSKDAKYGWYRYESRFALPVFDNEGEVIRYNVFHVAMILRHGEDGKKYLYDIMNKKRNE